MIITKEKYRDSYIVYIDETMGNIEDHSQVYADNSEDIRIANKWDYSLRRPRLGGHRGDLL
jgi:hypothetical protein